jgi:hypothetical protein
MISRVGLLSERLHGMAPHIVSTFGYCRGKAEGEIETANQKQQSRRFLSHLIAL